MKLWNPDELKYEFNYSELSAMQQVIPGIDTFLQDPEVNKNSKFVIVTNNAAFTSSRILSRLELVNKGFNLIKVFSPEHGISVKGADGSYQKDSIDIKTGLPIISLYGDRLMPTEEDLKDIDIVLFDIPDVGCRFYTYLWTMSYVMEACAKYNKLLIILDRPNPISGNLEMAEGPMLDEKNCASFIGRWSIPVKHSCTLGELAKYFSNKKIKGLDLKIIPVKNWNRDQITNDFYPTSPAIKNISTAVVYPGMGLLEGINVNEGRGTDNPFIQFGAPWINAEELQLEMKKKDSSGVDLKSCSYTPVDSLYKNETCYGLELNLNDINKFRPVAFGIDLISVLFKLYSHQVKERAYVTNVNPTGGGHLDKLLGVKNAFELLKHDKTIQTDISRSWLSEITSFLLYN